MGLVDTIEKTPRPQSEEPTPRWRTDQQDWANWIESDWFETWLQLARKTS